MEKTCNDEKIALLICKSHYLNKRCVLSLVLKALVMSADRRPADSEFHGTRIAVENAETWHTENIGVS